MDTSKTSVGNDGLRVGQSPKLRVNFIREELRRNCSLLLTVSLLNLGKFSWAQVNFTQEVKRKKSLREGNVLKMLISNYIRQKK